MKNSPVINELEVFALKHKLPPPLRVDDADGVHTFLYCADKTHRYAYALTWDSTKPHVLWVMLNPGTGETEGRRRNTFERCKKWSREQGYGGLVLGNVFSLRSKSAKDLLRLPYTDDDLNEIALSHLSRISTDIIVAWGNHGAKSRLPASLRELLPGARCFGLTQGGQPRHPLYVASSTPLVPW